MYIVTFLLFVVARTVRKETFLKKRGNAYGILVIKYASD